jgi:hypothetical protein
MQAGGSILREKISYTHTRSDMGFPSHILLTCLVSSCYTKNQQTDERNSMAAPVLSHFEKPITLSVNGIAIDEFRDPLPRISIVIRQGGVTIDSTSSSELGGVNSIM